MSDKVRHHLSKSESVDAALDVSDGALERELAGVRASTQ